MEDFSIGGKHYKYTQVPFSNDCEGCAFWANGRQTLCNLPVSSPVPDCLFGGKAYIFVEASQNALQQEQEESS